ncbi:MAG: acetyl-CoA C-acetyltransferase [Hyphomicrobiales bacterium]
MPGKRRPVYIVDGARTPFLKAEKGPGPFTPVDLAVHAGRSLLLRQRFEPQEFDDVILGCVNVHPDEVNPGRVAALRLGCGQEVPGWTVQRNCASGMQSIDTAARYIADGGADLILAGGTEALSHAPLLFSEDATRWFAELFSAKNMGDRMTVAAKLKPGFFKPSIGILRGLKDPVVKLSMGQTAEKLAHLYGITRREADEFAIRSHDRLAQAQESGHLEEMVPMIGDNGTIHDHDDGVRPGSTPEKLAKLKPAFEKPYGQVTPGNSSQITDGACWVVLASEDAVQKYRLKPMARIVDCEWAALDPAIMGFGPVLSSTNLMQRHGLKRGDIGTWEINEAFAAQVLACLRAWEDPKFCMDVLGLDEPFGAIDEGTLNTDGGAIALGHPVGTSGNRITLHLIHAARRLGARFGIATECIGGGMGGAMLLEIM